MRQWFVLPSILCGQHLLGEHCECHMFAGAISKGVSMSGYVERGLLYLPDLVLRHNDLAREMQRRGMNHNSPLSAIKVADYRSFVCPVGSLLDLASRCLKCRQRWMVSKWAPLL